MATRSWEKENGDLVFNENRVSVLMMKSSGMDGGGDYTTA